MNPKLKYKRNLPFDYSASKARKIYLKRLQVLFAFVAANLVFIFAHMLPFPLKVIAVIAAATFWGFWIAKTVYPALPGQKKHKEKDPCLHSDSNKKDHKEKRGNKFWPISLEMFVSALTATIAVTLTLLLDFGMRTEGRAEITQPTTTDAVLFRHK